MPLPEPPATKLVLYAYDACFESARVRRHLRQLGLPFEQQTLSPGDKSVVKFKFGKAGVPVLVEGPFVSDDLGEVLGYIDRTYGRGQRRPTHKEAWTSAERTRKMDPAKPSRMPATRPAKKATKPKPRRS